MLPGFRFLVAAVVLCLSMLVFGFGATALLRSAREEFASLPARLPAPQVAFIQPQASEPPPTLSMLRVETPEIKAAAPAEAAVAISLIPAPAIEPAPGSEKQAALGPGASDARSATAETAPAEPVRPELATETAGSIDAVSVPAAASPATELRSDEPAAVAAIAPAPTPDQPASTLTEADTQIVTNIAMLGGPAVDIEPVPLPKAKPVATPAKKKARVKEKPAKRRRLEARAEQPAPAAAAPTDAFGWQAPR